MDKSLLVKKKYSYVCKGGKNKEWVEGMTVLSGIDHIGV